MQITPLAIEGPLLLAPRVHGDARGHFAETFRLDLFEAAAGPVRFAQENQSWSARRGTVRGLHFQRPPRGQAKLVRALRGALLDVAVDARPGSPTFGRHVAVELSAENWRQLYIPEGFLHAFCTLEDDVAMAYKVSDYYSPDHEGCVRWDDPDLAIDWPVPAAEAVLTDRDRNAPRFRDVF